MSSPVLARGAAGGTILRFGEFSIDRSERLLRRNGEPVALPPKAVETLLILLESPGRVVSKPELIERVWPDTVVEENNLNQQISILRKILGEGSIQTVPKRGYRFALPFDEPSPAPPLALTSATTAVVSQKRVPWTMIAATLAILVAAAIAIVVVRSRPGAMGSVAVLPVEPLQPNEELSAIGLGITDATVQRLSYAPRLTVRPVAAVRKYLGAKTDAVGAGRELNVDAVIMGTIQRSGDDIRVSMELVDVRSNQTRWSVKIEEKASDIFRLQDIVAEAVLRSMPGTGGERQVSRKRPPVNPAAHDAFLKGRFYLSRRTAGDVVRAVAELERAVALDDSYGAAWASLASALNLQATHFVVEPSVAFARSRSAVRQALLLDPDSAEAHAAKGFVEFYHDWKWEEGERSFRRAIELDPTNGTYRQLLSNLMMATGRFEEGIDEIERAVEADPASLMVRAVAGRQYYLARQPERAVERLRETLAIDSAFAGAIGNLSHALLETGRIDEARRLGAEKVRRDGGTQPMLYAAFIEARAGNERGAREWMAKARETAQAGVSLPYDHAMVHGELGDYDAAFALLDEAIEKRYSGLVWLMVDPRADALRRDPRYEEYLGRVGLKK